MDAALVLGAIDTATLGIVLTFAGGVIVAIIGVVGSIANKRMDMQLRAKEVEEKVRGDHRASAERAREELLADLREMAAMRERRIVELTAQVADLQAKVGGLERRPTRRPPVA